MNIVRTNNDLRNLKISTANSRTDTDLKRVVVTWEKFYERLKTPKRTSETFEQYCSFDKNIKLGIKDVGYFVGGHFDGDIRKTENIHSRDLITLDMDYASFDFEKILINSVGEFEFFVYTTHSHSQEKPRCRLIFPLAREVSKSKYEPLVRKIVEKIGIKYFDKTTVEVGRPMFWPSVSYDGEYKFYINNGYWLDPENILNAYGNCNDHSKWPRFPNENNIERSYEKGEDPLEKEGIVGQFCRAYYPIQTAINEFLDGVYKEAGEKRYTFIEGTTYNGAEVYEDKFLHSFHESDPAVGRNRNAFDLVRIHKFEEMDKKIAHDTPMQDRPSYKKMKAWASELKEVKQLKEKEIREEFSVVEGKTSDMEQKATSAPFLIDFNDIRKKLGPIDWLVEGFIENDTTGVFFGEPGSFKSFLAMDIAFHVASGKGWHGNATKHGPVVYLAGEGHGGLARRQEVWLQHHQPDLSQIKLRYSNRAKDLQDEKSAKEVEKDIEDWSKTAGKPSLIIVDTLARNFNGDENSTGDMGQFVNNIINYLRTPFDCVVLIVHHCGLANKKRSRGSSALRAGIDFEYLIEKEKSSLIAKVICTKMKDAEYPEETWFQGKVKTSWDKHNETLDSLIFEKIEDVTSVKPLNEEVTKLLELIKTTSKNEKGRICRSEIRNKAKAEKIVTDDKKGTEKVKKMIYELESLGEIQRIGGELFIELLQPKSS